MADENYLNFGLDVESWVDRTTVDRITDGLLAEVALALAQEWMATAQVDCPYETGRLYHSAQIGEVHVEPGQVRVPLGYEAPYARWAHDMSPLHRGWFANAGALTAAVAERLAEETARGF